MFCTFHSGWVAAGDQHVSSRWKADGRNIERKPHQITATAIGVGYWTRTCTIKAHVWNSCTLGIKLWTIVINLKQINSFNAGQQVVSACTHPRSMGAGGLAGERMEPTRTNNTTSDKMWAKTTIYNSERGKLKHKTRVRARLFNKPNCGACGLKEGLLGSVAHQGVVKYEMFNEHLHWDLFRENWITISLETWWKMYIAIYFNSTKKWIFHASRRPVGSSFRQILLA